MNKSVIVTGTSSISSALASRRIAANDDTVRVVTAEHPTVQRPNAPIMKSVGARFQYTSERQARELAADIADQLSRNSPAALDAAPSAHPAWGVRLVGVIAGFLAHLKSEREVARATAALARMDDCDLADLGVERGKIEHAVRYGRDFD